MDNLQQRGSMKKSKLTKRISFLSTPDEFKEFLLKCIHSGQKYNTRLRELMKKDLDEK